MGLSKRYRKILALLLSASLVLTPLSVYAEEVAEEISTEVSSEETEEGDVTDADNAKADDAGAEDGEVTEPEDVSEVLKDEVEELKTMTPGEDYKPREAVFLTDSRAEALEVAKSYNADLIGFDYGVATLRFHESTVNALSRAVDNDDVTKTVEPNYTFEIFDLDDYEDDSAVSDGNADDTALETEEDTDTIAADNEAEENDGLETDGSDDAGTEDVLEEGSDEDLPGVFSDSDDGFSLDSYDAYIDEADPFADKSSSMNQYYHELIGVPAAHKITTGKGIKVAVLDTGVNPDHEDLKGKVSANFIPKFKDEGKGIDEHGHGTHVIGILAAEKDNGKGGYGVAPGVSVDSIQITRDGKIYLEDVVVGVNMAVSMKADVINMSLGTEVYSSTLQAAIDSAYNKGIVCVAAAGNKGTDIKHYPAAGDHCLATGASTAKDGELATYSNFGDWVDVIAPGSTINSTYLFDGTHNSEIPKKRKQGTNDNDSYGQVSGTSQSTPMVSAIAALCYASNAEFREKKGRSTAELITQIIKLTTDGKEYSNSTSSKASVTGRVQADKAVEMASSISLTTSHTLVDQAGHYGPLLSGYICSGKTVKLRIGGSDGRVYDKSLTKAATWESNDPSVLTVNGGKVKAVKNAPDGSKVLITAQSAGSTLYYVFTVHNPVKKFGLFSGGKVLKKTTISRPQGQVINLDSPYALVSDNNVAVFYTSKNSEINMSDEDGHKQADGRFAYDIKISKKDLQKVNVKEYDSSGDPVIFVPNQAGKIKVTYTLLDGSKRKFTVVINI